MARWVPHYLQGQYACRNLATDELLRGWRKGQRKLIWRGSLEDAVALCEQLASTPPPAEPSQSQVIMHVIAAQKRRQTSPVRSKPKTLTLCADCKKMVKAGHTCTT